MLTFPNDVQSYRYRVHVVAKTVGDAVANVGGWLVDLSMAGWDVRVLLPECDDDTPLHILGASSAHLVTRSRSARLNPLPDVWAVSTAFYTTNRWIRTATMAAQHDKPARGRDSLHKKAWRCQHSPRERV